MLLHYIYKNFFFFNEINSSLMFYNYDYSYLYSNNLQTNSLLHYIFNKIMCSLFMLDLYFTFLIILFLDIITVILYYIFFYNINKSSNSSNSNNTSNTCSNSDNCNDCKKPCSECPNTPIGSKCKVCGYRAGSLSFFFFGISFFSYLNIAFPNLLCTLLGFFYSIEPEHVKNTVNDSNIISTNGNSSSETTMLSDSDINTDNNQYHKDYVTKYKRYPNKLVHDITNDKSIWPDTNNQIDNAMNRKFINSLENGTLKDEVYDKRFNVGMVRELNKFINRCSTEEHKFNVLDVILYEYGSEFSYKTGMTDALKQCTRSLNK